MKSVRLFLNGFLFIFSLISCDFNKKSETEKELTSIPNDLETENKYIDNKKSGIWIEYLDSARLNEVAKASSYYTRLIIYNNGIPAGKFSDFITKTGKITTEGFLISGPYISQKKRPEDRYEGVLKKFDNKSSKISDFDVYDKYGDHDQKSFYVNGTDNIKNDSRYDSLYFYSSKENSIKIKAFEKFHNNPSLYVQAADAIIKRANNNPDYIDFIEFLSKKDKSKYTYFILFDAFELDNEIFNKFNSVRRKKSERTLVQESREIYKCLWCGKEFTFNDGTGTCSLRCRAERQSYQKSRAWEN